MNAQSTNEPTVCLVPSTCFRWSSLELRTKIGKARLAISHFRAGKDIHYFKHLTSSDQDPSRYQYFDDYLRTTRKSHFLLVFKLAYSYQTHQSN